MTCEGATEAVRPLGSLGGNLCQEFPAVSMAPLPAWPCSRAPCWRAPAATDRLVCGFHFRSDIVAGRQFGTIMVPRLMQDPQFHKDMAAAKTELKAAGLSS